MDKQRVLREAQKIATKYSFWMVSGNIAHLYGYVYEIEGKKFELEIKFEENFPTNPPQFIYQKDIIELLGNVQLDKLRNWTQESYVFDIIDELKMKIQKALHVSKMLLEENIELKKVSENSDDSFEADKFITPDLSKYPSDSQYEEYLTPSDSTNKPFNGEQTVKTSIGEPQQSFENSSNTPPKPIQESFFEESSQMSVSLNTELGLIQQEYAYDQLSEKPAEINIYITITLTKTFIIGVDFTNYPKKPIFHFPQEVKKLLGDPQKSLNILRTWNPKKSLHIVDILHELEKNLYFFKEIELQFKEIIGEYQYEAVSGSLTALKVSILTYGFKEYKLNVDLKTYPKPPIINFTSELQELINIPITELASFKNWINNKSKVVEIIREISWLIDKNSRINFEIDLLKDHYKDLKFDPIDSTLCVNMKGKMKTEDLTFEFQIILPIDYPMKIPEIKVLNEFELETHEKIKNDLHNSFDDFFNDWTPFSYLIDLFNLISKKIFEVSVVSCVICHKIECPSCSQKIAGENYCHAECPHCNRAYHKHCWEQTIKSFGKCGFCLR